MRRSGRADRRRPPRRGCCGWPGGQILISDDARLALERHVDFRPTGLRLARAGLAPQPVHELLGERRADTPFDSLDGGIGHR